MTLLAADAGDYPLLSIFWTMLELFLWIVWFFLLFRVFGDLFRSHDVSGWGKAGWTILLVLLPFLGVLIYLIVRGTGMHRRDAAAAEAADDAVRSYIRSTAGGGRSAAEDLEKLASLRDRGVINQQEFEGQKAKLLA